jgi:drug/metabolite transporter (DMT)-like permease
MPLTRAKWLKFLIAIVLGNALYFALLPHLPPTAQHRSWTVDLGTVVDFWFCLLVYGLLELGAFFHRDEGGPRRRKPHG